jgi:hypothetical protein
MSDEGNANIQIEVTDFREFHCFRLLLNTRDGNRIEVMFHARSLVDLIHKCSLALCDWQAQTSSHLIQLTTGLSEDDARSAGLIA